MIFVPFVDRDGYYGPLELKFLWPAPTPGPACGEIMRPLGHSWSHDLASYRYIAATGEFEPELCMASQLSRSEGGARGVLLSF